MDSWSDAATPTEVETTSTVSGSVIWLHGLGADGHDFEPVVPMLGLPATLGLRFVFPHAPLRPVTINGGAVMRAWYDIVAAPEGFRGDVEHIREAAAILQQLIRRELKRGIAARRIAVAGFSQGGAIALYTALRYPSRLAGVLALSTYLPLADTLETERAACNNDVPVFMAHGVYDPLIPLARAEESRTLLTQLGYDIVWQVYPMLHSVCPEEIEQIGVWLSAVFEEVKPAPS
ncbi:MAG: alpha/beta fold hydrolase [Acidiferrobacterales bacterium]|nr:alpha/beta fold hydrolase [Acidiferrobacterales bacterium]